MSDVNPTGGTNEGNRASNMMHGAAELMHEVAHELETDATKIIVEVKQLRTQVNRQDTISTLLVVGLTVLALIVGLFIWNSVVTKTTTYTDATGLKLTYPAGWVSQDTGFSSGTAGTVTVSQRAGSLTKFEVQRVAVDASAPATSTLSLVANNLATTRAQTLGSFKVLNTDALDKNK